MPGNMEPDRELPEYDDQARRMVRTQIESRGIASSRLLDAMRRLRRTDFLTTDRGANAFGDAPIAIGFGQTMSQPYMVALMVDALALRGRERVDAG